jgi:hypothetical protein
MKRLGDGALVIACYRGKRPTYRLCDGCDARLEPKDSVSPQRELDFCPTCAKPAFDWWKANAGGAAVYAGSQPLELKRNAFRFWARANARQFLLLVKRSAESLEQVPDQSEMAVMP